MANLQITTIQNGTKPEEEYIELYAVTDVQLSGYAILDRTFDKDGNLSNKHRHFYHFPDKAMKAGDYARIYTGKGTPTTSLANAGTTKVNLHWLYWNMGECIWNNNSKDRATLIRFQYEYGKSVN